MSAGAGSARTRTRTERRVLSIAVVLLVGAVGWALASSRDGDDVPEGLSLGWGGPEGRPSCTWVPDRRTVEATIVVRGTVPRPEKLVVTVSAYADENASRRVGSATRTLTVDGAVDESVVVTIPVRRPPHLGEDGEAACRLG